MAGKRASFPDTEDVSRLVAAALGDLSSRRGGVDEPGDYIKRDHPWTSDLCARLSERLDEALIRSEPAGGEPPQRHILLGPVPAQAENRMRVLHGPAQLYPVSWRIETADGAAMTGLPLVVETIWRGGWRELAGACDRLSIANAQVRALLVAADPAFDLGGMSVAEAAAFRMNAFLRAGEICLLGFWGGRGSWRETPGFSVMRYVAGETQARPYATG